MPHYLSPLKSTCIRQVMLDKWSPLIVADGAAREEAMRRRVAWCVAARCCAIQLVCAYQLKMLRLSAFARPDSFQNGRQLQPSCLGLARKAVLPKLHGPWRSRGDRSTSMRVPYLKSGSRPRLSPTLRALRPRSGAPPRSGVPLHECWFMYIYIYICVYIYILHIMYMYICVYV